jgi:hypothetical protein
VLPGAAKAAPGFCIQVPGFAGDWLLFKLLRIDFSAPSVRNTDVCLPVTSIFPHRCPAIWDVGLPASGVRERERYRRFFNPRSAIRPERPLPFAVFAG